MSYANSDHYFARDFWLSVEKIIREDETSLFSKWIHYVHLSLVHVFC